MPTSFEEYNVYLETKNINLSDNAKMKLSQSFDYIKKNNNCKSEKVFNQLIPYCFPNIAVGYLYLQEFGTVISMFHSQREKSLFGMYKHFAEKNRFLI